jgi:cob(I)alamin adenosyltransferase
MTLVKINKRYEIENMPISEKTREGIAKGNLSDALQTLLRAMGMLEFNLEESVAKINDKLASIDSRLTSIELRLSSLEAKDRSFEEKIALIEKRLDDYYLRLKNHKHEQYEKAD